MTEKEKKLRYEKPELIDIRKSGAAGDCDVGSGAEPTCSVGHSPHFGCMAGIDPKD